MENPGEKSPRPVSGDGGSKKRFRTIDPETGREEFLDIDRFISLPLEIQYKILTQHGVSPYDLEKVCIAVALKVIRSKEESIVSEKAFLDRICGSVDFWKIKYQISFDGIIEPITPMSDSTSVRYWKKMYIDAFRFAEKNIVKIFIRLSNRLRDPDMNIDKYKSNVERLVQSGISMNTKDENGNTVLLLFSKRFPSARSYKKRLGLPWLFKQFIFGGADVTIEDDTGTNALMVMAAKGHYKVLEFFLDVTKVDVDHKNLKGFTPLMMSGTVDTARFLISRGADLYVKSKHGYTTLLNALYMQHPDVAEFFISNGVPVNAYETDGIGALHLASKNGYVNIVEMLLSNNAEVDHKTSQGVTPLMLSARNGHLKIVRMLISKGADASIKDNYGLTATDLARNQGHRAIVNYLGEVVRQYGMFSIKEHIFVF